MTRAGRITVLLAGVLLLAASGLALVRASALGAWALAGLLAAALVVVVLPLASAGPTGPVDPRSFKARP